MASPPTEGEEFRLHITLCCILMPVPVGDRHFLYNGGENTKMASVKVLEAPAEEVVEETSEAVEE